MTPNKIYIRFCNNTKMTRVSIGIHCFKFTQGYHIQKIDCSSPYKPISQIISYTLLHFFKKKHKNTIFCNKVVVNYIKYIISPRKERV